MGVFSLNSLVFWEFVLLVGKEELYVGFYLKDEKKKICGFGKWIFIMVLVVVIVLIGVVVGGGVVGVMRVKYGESLLLKIIIFVINRILFECVVFFFIFCLLLFFWIFVNLL